MRPNAGQRCFASSPAIDGMGCAGPTSIPILHLHLLQRCNLRCHHCYSNSSPAGEAALTLDQALGAVEFGASFGFTHLAISGGEPLLSPHLEAVIAMARALGQHVSIITNGLHADEPAALRRLSGADSVCVSLDGVGATHDALRGRSGAYDRAIRALTSMADAGLHCGVSCGVSVGNLDELETLVAAACHAGARFVNFHAIEAAGRATAMRTEELLDKPGHTVLYIAANVIAQATADRCAVHCDLLHKHAVSELPSLLYLGSAGDNACRSPASQLGVLVVEPTGQLAPVCFGFDRALSLGSLQEALDTKGDSVARCLPSVLTALKASGDALLKELEADDEWVVFNPSAELARTSAQRSYTVRPMHA